jgi:hypothetical protein
MPTKSFLKHFRADFEACVKNGGSPMCKRQPAGAAH